MIHDSPLQITRTCTGEPSTCGCSDSDLTALGTEDRRLQPPTAPAQDPRTELPQEQDQLHHLQGQGRGSFGCKDFRNNLTGGSETLRAEGIPSFPQL